MTLHCRSSLTGASLVSQIHDVAIDNNDNDRCKEHLLESLKGLKAPALLYQWFSFGVIQVVFLFPGMTTASDLFCPTWNSSWLARQEPFNKTQNSKCFGLLVWSKILVYISHTFSIFPKCKVCVSLAKCDDWGRLLTWTGASDSELGGFKDLVLAEDAPWEQIPTAREVWNRWSFLKRLKIWRKKCLHGNFMKFCRFSRIDWLSVVNFGWMNLNLPQDFTRCWLCVSFAW